MSHIHDEIERGERKLAEQARKLRKAELALIEEHPILKAQVVELTAKLHAAELVAWALSHGWAVEDPTKGKFFWSDPDGEMVGGILDWDGYDSPPLPKEVAVRITEAQEMLIPEDCSNA